MGDGLNRRTSTINHQPSPARLPQDLRCGEHLLGGLLHGLAAVPAHLLQPAVGFVLGDVEAASLGVNVGRTRMLLVAAATLGTAAAVAMAGTIAFVGIVVPHTIRLLTGGSYRTILPLSMIAGAGFLILCDLAARTLIAPGELPIGVITAFVGAPFFIVLLRRSHRVAT